MIIIQNDPTRFFSVVGAPYVPEASNRETEHFTQPVDDPERDPELCWRIGQMIARAMQGKSA